MYLLPVSLGEAIDKLSILQIKCENITDARKLDVEKEYSALYEILKDFVVKYAELYESMLATNRVIWQQMDVLRDGDHDISDVEYTKLCRECIVTNDIRYRIKNKINLISNSELREQKSYKIRRFSMRIEVGDEDLLLFIEPIRRLSYIYDEIHVISSKDLSVIRDTFHYDNTIICGGCTPTGFADRTPPAPEGGVTVFYDICGGCTPRTPPAVEGGVEGEVTVFYDTNDICARLGLS